MSAARTDNPPASARRARSDAIRRDPKFRAQFHTMCAQLGVDPLASNKGAWCALLGFGDFYFELAVQVVECCVAARAATRARGTSPETLVR